MLPTPNVKWLLLSSSLTVASGWAAFAFLSGATYGTGALILSSLISGGVVTAMLGRLAPWRKRQSTDDAKKLEVVLALWKRLLASVQRYHQLNKLYEAAIAAERAEEQKLMRKLTECWAAGQYVLRDYDRVIPQDNKSRAARISRVAIDNLRQKSRLITQEEAWVMCQ